MSAPDYDKSLWTLLARNGNWVLLNSLKKQDHACLLNLVDGDWELNDDGSFQVMRTKYTRVTGKSPITCGIDLESFDQAFPHSEWHPEEAFTAPLGVEYALWRDNSRSVNPRAFSVCMSREDDEIHWSIIVEGKWKDVKEGFDRCRATLEDQPEPVLSVYAAHPNFGKF